MSYLTKALLALAFLCSFFIVSAQIDVTNTSGNPNSLGSDPVTGGADICMDESGGGNEGIENSYSVNWNNFASGSLQFESTTLSCGDELKFCFLLTLGGDPFDDIEFTGMQFFHDYNGIYTYANQGESSYVPGPDAFTIRSFNKVTNTAGAHVSFPLSCPVGVTQTVLIVVNYHLCPWLMGNNPEDINYPFGYTLDWEERAQNSLSGPVGFRLTRQFSYNVNPTCTTGDCPAELPGVILFENVLGGAQSLRTASPGAIEPIQEFSFSPNPLHQKAYATFNLEDESIVDLYLTDINGRKTKVILGAQTFSAGLNKIKVDVSGIPGGFYYGVLKTPSTKQTVKLLIH